MSSHHRFVFAPIAGLLLTIVVAALPQASLAADDDGEAIKLQEMMLEQLIEMNAELRALREEIAALRETRPAELVGQPSAEPGRVVATTIQLQADDPVMGDANATLVMV